MASFVENLFGTAKSGSGGTQDAFTEYLKLVESLEPLEKQARFDIIDTINPYIGQLGQSFRDIGSSFSSLPEDLGLEELARSTSDSQGALLERRAVEQARAVSGRGGLAFSGGAAAIASAASRDSSLERESILTNSLFGARQAESNYDLARSGAIDQFQLARAGGIETGQQASAELSQRTGDSLLQLNLAGLENRTNLGGQLLSQGLAGNAARAERKMQATKSLSGLNLLG